MSISFTCEQCKKKVKAPDNAGGKWGSCPFCQHKCYIPSPETENDLLSLAPIDEREKTRHGHLISETFLITKEILKENAIPDDEKKPRSPAANNNRLKDNITQYLICIAQGQLEQANKLAENIRSKGRAALDTLDEIAENPGPELADIAPGLLAGLIRKFRGQLK